MRFAIAVENGGKDQAWGVIVPGLPGCFSAGDTFDEAVDNAREAIELHLDALLDAGDAVPAPVPMEAIAADPEFSGFVLASVDVDFGQIGGKSERINITLPRRVIRILDQRAEQSRTSRSGMIAELAVQAGGSVAQRAAGGVSDRVPPRKSISASLVGKPASASRSKKAR